MTDLLRRQITAAQGITPAVLPVGLHRREVTKLLDLHAQAAWRRSLRCEAGSCVEVAFLDEAVAVRDSKVSRGPLLQFPHSEWQAFVAGIRAGEFD